MELYLDWEQEWFTGVRLATPSSFSLTSVDWLGRNNGCLWIELCNHSPVANILISNSGVTSAFMIIGIAFLLIICVASFFIEKCPADFVPSGWTPSAVQLGRTPREDKDWKGMLASPIFYVMILLLISGAFAGLMCTSQASPIAQKMVGMSAAAATTVVSVLALFNTGGRILAGYISDKIGRINTLAITSLLSVAGLTMLYFSGGSSVGTFYMGISMIGLSFGSLMGYSLASRQISLGPKQQRKLRNYVYRICAGWLFRSIHHEERVQCRWQLSESLCYCSSLRPDRIYSDLCI